MYIQLTSCSQIFDFLLSDGRKWSTAVDRACRTASFVSHTSYHKCTLARLSGAEATCWCARVTSAVVPIDHQRPLGWRLYRWFASCLFVECQAPHPRHLRRRLPGAHAWSQPFFRSANLPVVRSKRQNARCRSLNCFLASTLSIFSY